MNARHEHQDFFSSLQRTMASLRVLLVEDDPVQLGMVSKLIGNVEQAEHLHITLDFASTAKEGLGLCELHALAGRAHDLVLLDYLLPGGDADTVVASIRSVLGKRAVSLQWLPTRHACLLLLSLLLLLNAAALLNASSTLHSLALRNRRSSSSPAQPTPSRWLVASIWAPTRASTSPSHPQR